MTNEKQEQRDDGLVKSAVTVSYIWSTDYKEKGIECQYGVDFTVKNTVLKVQFICFYLCMMLCM